MLEAGIKPVFVFDGKPPEAKADELAKRREKREEANKELEKIDAKLSGVVEAHGPGALSVPGQVQQLINDATDAKNLAQMFIWWMPWC